MLLRGTRLLRSGSFFVLAGASSVGCGGTTDGGVTGFNTPYDPGSATVIGKPGGDQSIPKTSDCGDPSCKAAVDKCGANGAADVVVDADGNVLDVICYGHDVTVTDVPTSPVLEYTSDGNNSVLVLDGQNDGPDITANLTITGNNAIVYGQGPAVSVIGGTVQVEKNNAEIRGVRVDGDVTIDKNNTKLVFCVIQGNLTITGNNTTVADCDVFGQVTITGENTVLVGDRFAGIDTVNGPNLTCSADTRFDDANKNGFVDAGETGGAVSCPGGH